MIKNAGQIFPSPFSSVGGQFEQTWMFIIPCRKTFGDKCFLFSTQPCPPFKALHWASLNLFYFLTTAELSNKHSRREWTNAEFCWILRLWRHNNNLREYEISQKWANFKKRPQILDKPMSGTLLSGKSPIRTQLVKKNPADGLKNQIATNF